VRGAVRTAASTVSTIAAEPSDYGLTIRLKTVIRTTPLVAALKDGRIAPDGVELELEEVTPITSAFRVMCRELAYDVAEMAATTYLVAREAGKPFTALPVFLTRGFHHRAVVAREPAAPKSLEGRRVGVNRGYTVTTGVWARGILATRHGVDLDSITWVRSDMEHVAEYAPPSNVEDLEPGRELADAVLSGELAAAVGDVRVDGLVPLLADADEAAEREARQRHTWPINHLVVVRDELLAEHPGLAPVLVDAFEQAKAVYLDSGEVEPLHARAAELVGGDPFPYGVERNREVLEELVGYAVAQKILRRRPTVDELFA
jgi:ABC-type nitrate/sulfonate/bicarbonate transport system substrate-binding protein